MYSAKIKKFFKRCFHLFIVATSLSNTLFAVDILFDNFIDAGGSIITATKTDGADTYVLRAVHVSDTILDNTVSVENPLGIDIFFNINHPTLPNDFWTITMKKNDEDAVFTLNSIYYDALKAGPMTIVNQNGAEISNQSYVIDTQGDMPISNTENATAISSFKIVTSVEALMRFFGFGLINVTPVIPINNAPVTTNLNGDSFTYTEGNAATLIDQAGDATLSDADSADFNGGDLSATITSGEDAAEDLLAIDISGSVALAGTVAGANVSVSGTVIGTLGNTIAAGNDLIINLNANATPVNVQTLMRAITYQNVDTVSPSTGERNVRVTINDGDGATSDNADVTVTVEGLNNAPSSQDVSFTINENTIKTFSSNEFNFTDLDTGDTLHSIFITTLPSAGSFILSGMAVTLNQEIPSADIVNLIYLPQANANGTPYTSFGFKVNDGDANSTSVYAATINVNAAGDVPPNNETPPDTSYPDAVVNEVLISTVNGETVITTLLSHVEGSEITVDSAGTSIVTASTTNRNGEEVQLRLEVTSDGILSFSVSDNGVATNISSEVAGGLITIDEKGNVEIKLKERNPHIVEGEEYSIYAVLKTFATGESNTFFEKEHIATGKRSEYQKTLHPNSIFEKGSDIVFKEVDGLIVIDVKARVEKLLFF